MLTASLAFKTCTSIRTAFAEHALRALQSKSFGPGKRLEVDLASPTSVTVRHGDLERILVQLPQQPTGIQRFQVAETELGFDVKEERPGSQSAHINAWIPERFCGLHIRTQDAAVDVQGLTEAALSIRTGGGHVQAGKVKATASEVSTSGGDVKGALTAEIVTVDSRSSTGQGGAVALSRLSGNDVHVHTGGGSVDVEACYCEKVEIDSSGGDVTIGHLRAFCAAEIVTGAGALRIRGCDGNAAITTQGGDIDLQVTEGLRKLKCASNGGNIRIQVGPTVAGTITAYADNGVHLSPDLKLSDLQRSDIGTQAVLAAPQGSGTATREDSLSKEVAIELHAGSGAVFVKQQSWIDSVKSRIHATACS